MKPVVPFCQNGSFLRSNEHRSTQTPYFTHFHMPTLGLFELENAPFSPMGRIGSISKILRTFIKKFSHFLLGFLDQIKSMGIAHKN